MSREKPIVTFELQGFLDSGATDRRIFEKSLPGKAKTGCSYAGGGVFSGPDLFPAKEFALSLSLLEKSEAYLAEENQELSLLIGKETYVLKMAYRYSDN